MGEDDEVTTWAITCLACAASFSNEDQAAAMAAFDEHHEQAHPDTPPRVSVTDGSDADFEIGRHLLEREILSALAASDRWAARAVEDAVPMPPTKIAYRKRLRSLLPQVKAATSPDELSTIELPEEPNA